MGGSSQPLWAEVMVDVRVSSVDRTFHYAVPEHLRDKVTVGHRVLVPFGNRPQVEGYVVGLTAEPPPVEQVKTLQSLLEPEPLFSPADLEAARWMAEHYMCLLVQALQCFLPPGVSMRRSRPVSERRVKAYRLAVSVNEAMAYMQDRGERAPRQLEVLRVLLETPDQPVAASILAQSGGYGVLRALEERGLIGAELIQQQRRPSAGLATENAEIPELTPAQSQAVSKAVQALAQRDTGVRTMLLHGVTGSGKTEVYMRVIGAALNKGMGAILLVPDIALTPQTVGRFQSRFGGQIAVLHSRLSEGERYDEWYRIKNGEARVVVGARSAVFAPVQNLGVIVIDEEHETSYKQDEAPRYHARAVAEARLREVGGLVLLGSATPSLEAYYDVRQGTMDYVALPERVGKRPLPETEIVDMREELLVGNRSMFSRSLQVALVDTFSRGEQAIILLNRRGFASFMLCRECGLVPRCRDCGVSLTLHQDPPRLHCHYCGETWSVPAACPDCTGPYLRPFGVGTQRVEHELRQMYPGLRIARMDRDTTARKGAHQRLLSAFARREIDILVGTQMVAKGLDFPDVTLVGVISADTALHFPDFRAAERTFQLLTQVAGRAGRGDLAGRVILQTYSPEHYAIQAASRHDYTAFVAHELNYRRSAGYPPFVSLVRILLTGEDEKEVIRTANCLRVEQSDDIQAVGPAPAPLSKLKGKFRWHMLVKGPEKAVRETIRGLLAKLPAGRTVNVAVDVDPVSLL